MIEIGDVIKMKPHYGNQCISKKKDGVVVYIHPRRRFMTLEFEGADGKYRESFIIPKIRKDQDEIIKRVRGNAGGY